MVRYDAGTTNPTLLNRLGDWRDHEAWVDFVTRYDPVIRLSSRRYRLDAESTEELCPAGLDRPGAANAHLPLRPREDVSRLAQRRCANRGRSIYCPNFGHPPCRADYASPYTHNVAHEWTQESV